jgi:hypothetical protein
MAACVAGKFEAGKGAGLDAAGGAAAPRPLVEIRRSSGIYTLILYFPVCIFPI